ncbi:DUF2304 domain-containing protein [Pyxidicoccus xibeiensis]|uniref:DUF2304 domain-containing protein n=1 Tax=Pyxidicoccus xibeiensis TaxID=2906759 RepID=UPI0020A79024|nr:DUF2304 domain-containing protein [Pyxidicoccus xibeiensis]MCP3138239.1 DUF2304 domain-containing protein [Pyxidicoccus xibeiensis]
MFRSSLVGVAFAALFALAVLLSARTRRTNERHTFAWLMVAAAVAGLSLWRDGVDALARAMGIYYPPSALFFLACTALMWLVYRLSLQVAEQRKQLTRLAQEVAILAAAEQVRSGKPRTESERAPATSPQDTYAA